MEKEMVLTLIASASSQDLWDVILTLQTDLYFDWDKSYFQNYLPWWSDAKNILFIGCGNGAHMTKFAEAFPTKKFHGIDNNREHIKIATQRNQLNNAYFAEENVYELNKEVLNCYDIVVMRFVIQHLENLKCALINEEILGKLFSIGTSNIDKNGEAIANQQLDLLLDNNKTPLFAQKMIFFGLWKKQYNIDINLGTVFDEYKKFLSDPDARLAEGFHVLTLKKL